MKDWEIRDDSIYGREVEHALSRKRPSAAPHRDMYFFVH
jgi:hypothetical protein